jgi:hypothetical protein
MERYNTTKFGHDLAQDFEPLRREIDGEEVNAGHPSAGLRNTLD